MGSFYVLNATGIPVDIRQCDQNTKVIADIVDIDRCITVLEMTVVMPGYLWVALSFGEEIATP